MKAPLALAALAAVGLASCSRTHDDATFDGSYDECVLKNASKGGDSDARQAATDICARHFTRTANDKRSEREPRQG